MGAIVDRLLTPLLYAVLYPVRKVKVGVFTRIKDSHIEKNVKIGSFSFISGSTIRKGAGIGNFNKIVDSVIGKYSYTNERTTIINTKIGNYCSISWNVTIGAPEHPLDRFTTHPITYSEKYQNSVGLLHKGFDQHPRGTTEIGHDVWIGANVIIRSGTRIGTGAVIGAGSVVTKDVPPYAIVAGVPAKIIRFRFPEDVRKALLRSRWWEKDPTELKEIDLLNELLG